MDDDNISLETILNNCHVEYDEKDDAINNNKNEIIELYQIDGVFNENFAYLKLIGINNHRPVILIKEFSFKDKKCQIVSYFLSKIDLDNDMKMLGLLIYDKNKVVAAITLSFVPDIKNNMEEYISTNDTNPILGKYVYIFRCKNEKIGEVIGGYNKFIGKTESLYELIRLLSNKKLISLFD